MKFTQGGRQPLARVCSPQARGHRMVAAVLLVFHLLLGALFSLAVPLWEAYDEWAHYKFVEYVARHRTLPPPGQRLTNEYEFDEANQPPLYYIIAALPVMLVDTNDGVVPQVNPYFNVQTGAGGINAAIHLPEQARFPGRGTLLALRLARAMSLLISLVGLVSTYKLGRLLAPDRPVVALTALAIAALSPQYLFISAVVTNDVLIAALGCVVAWLGVKVALTGLRTGPVLALTLAIGLALVTKLSALALLPCVAIACVIAATRSLRRGASRRRVGVMLGAGTAAGLLLLVLWLWRNLRLTGDFLPRDPWAVWRFYWRWIERSDAMPPLRLEALPAGLGYAFRTFWASFGWGNLEAYRWVYWLFAGLCLAGLLGLLLWLGDRHVDRQLKLAAGLAALLAGSLLFMAAYRDFDQGSTLIRGRYLLPALASVAALTALGLDALLHLVPGRAGLGAGWPASVFLAVLTVVLVITNALLPWQVIAPAYVPPPMIATGTTLGEPVALQPGERPLSARFLVTADDPVPAAELVAYELWPETVHPAAALGVTLVWRVLRPLTHNYTVGVHLLDADQVKVGEVNVYPGRGAYATTLWRPGDVFRDVYWVPVQRQLSQPMLGRVKVALFVDGTAQADPTTVGQHLPVADAQGTLLGDAVVFGRFKLTPARPLAEPGVEPGLATLGETIRLSAAVWQAGQTPVLAGSAFTVTLTWEALSRPSTDYQVFVHLEGSDGPLAFGDGPPARGRYPTGLWERGDRIEDVHLVRVPDQVPRGTYRLLVGMYDTAGGRPVTVGPDGERLTADQIFLDHVTVARLERRGFIPLYLASGGDAKQKEP